MTAVRKQGVDVSDLYWPSDAQMVHLEPCFRPMSVGNLEGERRQAMNGGTFTTMIAGLAAEHSEKKTVMINATYLKAYRTAFSLRRKGGAVT